MPISQNKIIIQRLLFALNAALFFILAAATFFWYISLPTDENWFRDVNSNLMLVRSLPASLQNSKPLPGSHPNFVPAVLDSMKTGDLVLTVNGGSPKTIKDIYEFIQNGPKEVRFEILRPSLNYMFEFRADRSLIADEYFVRLPNFVLITDVVPNGASDRAGMKVGDLIVRINEKDFTNAVEADQILRLGQIGKSLTYDVLRTNEYKTFQVILSKFGIPFGVLLFSLSGFVFMMFGSFIAVSRPNILSAKLLGLGFLYVGFFMAIVFVRRDFIITPFITARNILMLVGLFLGIALLLHSMHYFPVERPELKNRRWTAPSYYLLSAILGVVTAVTNNALYVLIIPLYAGFILFRFRKFSSADYKKFNTIIKWTSIGAFIVSVVSVYLFRNSTTGIQNGIIGVMLALLPVSYLYTIGRYRLLDLNFKVRRNTQYSIITTAWGTAVFGFLIYIFFSLPQVPLPTSNLIFTGASIEIGDATSTAANKIPVDRILLMLLALASTFVFVKVRHSGQQFIDKKYFRQQYDYRKASNEIAGLLSTTVSLQDLAHNFIQKLCELMTLKKGGVMLFRGQTSCAAVEAYGFDPVHWKEYCRQYDRLLISSVRQFNNEFRVDYLPPAIKERMHEEGFQYLVPIVSKERLIGVIMVGEKRAETMLQQEDFQFLSSAARQAAVAIDNAFLYEELAEKERMKHELEIARRIQLESLPQDVPQISGLQIAGTSVPAMEVGGDFYDYLSNDSSSLTIIIGDVSGKGTSAALYMSKVQGILRSLHGFDLSPKELFNRANKLLCKDLEKRSFVTVLGAEFINAKRTLSVARAGHLPLLRYRAESRNIEKVLPRGLGLGLNDKGVFTSEMEELKITYSAGDIFLFATDGITEAHTGTADFGEDRLCDLLIKFASSSAEEIQKQILDAVKEFAGSAPQHDDQTIVVVKAVEKFEN